MTDTCKTCGNKIETMAFKGTGYCSVNCEKAAGHDHVDYGKADLMLVSRGEAAAIREARSHGSV